MSLQIGNSIGLEARRVSFVNLLITAYLDFQDGLLFLVLSAISRSVVRYPGTFNEVMGQGLWL